MHHFFLIKHFLIKNGLMRRNAAYMSCHFAAFPSIYVAALRPHRYCLTPTLPPLESEFSELIKRMKYNKIRNKIEIYPLAVVSHPHPQKKVTNHKTFATRMGQHQPHTLGSRTTKKGSRVRAAAWQVMRFRARRSSLVQARVLKRQSKSTQHTTKTLDPRAEDIAHLPPSREVTRHVGHGQRCFGFWRERSYQKMRSYGLP